MATLTNARIGRPWPLNRVYLALTEVTNAGKLEIWPQCSTTIGGDGFLGPALSSVGTQQLEQLLDRLDHGAVLGARGVEEHLQGELARLRPTELGGPAFFDPLVVLRSHLAVLAIVTSFGLNWKAIAPRLLPALLPPLAGAGS